MSVVPATSEGSHRSHLIALPQDPAHRIGVIRAVLAVAWAVALFAEVSHNPGRFTDLMTGVAITLATYPLIDAVANLAGARSEAPARRVLLISAAVSLGAVVALAVAGLGSDAGSTLATFGVWAIASGALQFGVGAYRRHRSGGQVPILISGGLSVIVGGMFIAGSTNHVAKISSLGGYMLLGAALFVIWSVRDAARARKGR